MRRLKYVAMLLALAGLVVVLAGVGFSFFLKNTKDGRALAVQWQLTRIFQEYDHGVAWDRLSYARVSPYIQEEIRNWGGGEEIRIYISNRLHLTRTVLPPLTFVHVFEVVNIPQRGEPLFLFLFESPFQPGRDDPFKQQSYELVASPLTHRHGFLNYFHIGTAFAWGDLSLFPLERYFSFKEMEKRKSWVKKAQKRTLFWGWGIGGTCLFLGSGFLARFYFPVARPWIITGVKKIPLHWRSAYAMTGILLGAMRAQKENTDNGAPDRDDIQDKKDRSARERILFLFCLLYCAEREMNDAREAARAEHEAIHKQIALVHSKASGEEQARIAELLNQFPRESGRVHLRKARALLRETLAIGAEREVPVTASLTLVEKIADDAGGEKEPGFQEKDQTATDADAPETRWLYGLLEDVDPYIKEEGGDPLVAKTIILCGFLRPKKQDPFVAGNYGRMRHIRENVQRKRGEVKRVFGRRLLLEEIEENFALLKKGGVIMENDTHPGRVVCSLNDDEKAVGYPWCEVIRIANRARHQLLLLRSGGRR